jgi:integrase
MTGSITKHKQKNGRISWGYVYDAGTPGKRQQRTKMGFKTKAEADAALRDALKAAEAGVAPAKRDPRTFAEFFDAWIREHCERNCEASTTEGYIAKGAYAKRHFGEIPIVKVTPLQIQTALNQLRDCGGKKTEALPAGKPLSVKTVREIAAVISMTFNAAIRWGVLDLNPMTRVTLPRSEKREAKVLQKPELEWFLAGVEGHDWLHALLLLDAATGCRRGELLALSWSDVDLDLGVVSVAKSLAQTRAKGVFLKQPKGRKARRFSLPPFAVEALQAHRTVQARNRAMFGADYRSDLDLVFATPEGEYLRPDSVTAKVSLRARQLGFPKGVSLHTLRHTHGSHLLSSGVPLATVSKRRGHANTHITASVYSHALEKDDLLSAEALEKTLGDLGKTGMLGNVRTKAVSN